MKKCNLREIGRKTSTIIIDNSWLPARHIGRVKSENGEKLTEHEWNTYDINAPLIIANVQQTAFSREDTITTELEIGRRKSSMLWEIEFHIERNGTNEQADEI